MLEWQFPHLRLTDGGGGSNDVTWCGTIYNITQAMLHSLLKHITSTHVRVCVSRFEIRAIFAHPLGNLTCRRQGEALLHNNGV